MFLDISEVFYGQMKNIMVIILIQNMTKFYIYTHYLQILLHTENFPEVSPSGVPLYVCVCTCMCIRQELWSHL